MKALKLSLYALVLCFLTATRCWAAYPNDALATDFKLWWDNPVRAATGVPLAHQYTYYEKENRDLTWSILNAPVGMGISDHGVVTWASPSNGTYSNIQVTATRSTCNSTEYPGCVLSITNTFTLTVGTADFVYVSTGGTDSGSCTIGAPCATIGYAASKITGTDGKTIYVRGGNYTEAFASPLFNGQTFTPADYTEIRSYPGEAAVINAAAGYGLQTDTSQYVVFSNIEVKNASGTEGGNFILKGSHKIAKDCISHDANWDANANVAGILLTGDDVVSERCVSYNNLGSSGNVNNNSNWLAYNDVSSALQWVLNAKSWGSTFSFKIKHTNASGAKTIWHNVEGIGTGFVGAGTHSSLRYGLFYHQAGNGISLSLTDPSAFTTGGMLVEHNVVESTSTSADSLEIVDGYLTSGVATFRRNIFYNAGGACGAGNDVRKSFQLWQFTSPLATPRAYPFDSDYNIFWNTAGLTNCFIVGSNGVSPTVLDLAEYQALTGGGITRDPNSTGADPQLASIGSGNWNITSASRAATVCQAGQFCGAFYPDQVYGTVGVQSTAALIDFEQTIPAPPGTNPPGGISRRQNRKAKR